MQRSPADMAMLLQMAGEESGLSQNVVFDQFRNKKGVNALGGTEGARPYYGGGSAKVSQGHATGTYVVKERLPSGVEVRFNVFKDPRGVLDANVSFSPVGRSRGRNYSGKSDNPSTKAALSRFNDVFGAIERFTSRVQPRSLQFEAGGGNLQRFYDRMAPQMAQRLGAQLSGGQGTNTGMYRFDFPSASIYPLKRAP